MRNECLNILLIVLGINEIYSITTLSGALIDLRKIKDVLILQLKKNNLNHNKHISVTD